MPTPPCTHAHAHIHTPLPTTTGATMPLQNIPLETPTHKEGIAAMLLVAKTETETLTLHFFKEAQQCVTPPARVCQMLCIKTLEQRKSLCVKKLARLTHLSWWSPSFFQFPNSGGCSDSSHPSQHICSGCRKSGHGAQQCAQEQKRQAAGLVFAGPVRWTGKKTEIELNPTAKYRTTSCSCTNSEFFRLPVVRFVKKSKNQKKPVETGRNWAFVPLCVGTYSRTFFPNCRSLNDKKRSIIGWDMAKNIFIRNSNVCPFHFPHISAKS